MADTATKNTNVYSGEAPIKTLASAMAGVNLSGDREAPPAERPLPNRKVVGLTRRMSFTGRPIDIVRDACSTQRNELVSLFGRWVGWGAVTSTDHAWEAAAAAAGDSVAARLLQFLQHLLQKS
jgi:hypothetical protein